mmetsp:Transcript_23716/g.23927  ORF Transcript_23716/g.23927 Transcript_23716/m.23927 type:complete len:326 (+) Transcript_23716:96-1073(+)|eukprot:CAMPEP_0182429200 /NCGR_PEP_ID=MMETSP1167-20130531/25588_1 /TAXON_ID=2988 /ORGANISM="Mallomonas Sp, Strain CCMP3275" /LENGTH=325 /DNA_ID=CAMNT_0024612583 /DNA_START=41 /DNA_END=1018 /DNA_ORIENTATION=+
MEESNSLLGKHYQAITADDIEKENDGVEIQPSPVRYRNIMIAALVVIATASMAVLLQTGYLDFDEYEDWDEDFAAFARRDPGEPMLNGDELWPCKSDPTISGASCSPESTMYSNIYVDTGYTTTNRPPYKMLFLDNNILLYSRSRSSSNCAWELLHPQVVSGVIKCNGVPTSLADWGEPYYDLAKNGKLKNFDPVKITNKGGNQLTFTNKSVKGKGKRKKTVTSKNYKIEWQKITQVFKGKGKKRRVKTKTKTLYTFPQQVNAWGCDGVAFVLTTDGNLVLGTYQTAEMKAEVGKKACNVLWHSGNFMGLGGQTIMPTMEPTMGP